MTLQSGTVNQIPWNSQKCLTLYFSNAGIFFQCQSKAILQSGSKYDRSEVQLKFFSHYDIQIIFWIRYLGMHYAAWQYAWSLLYYSIKSWIKVYNTNWRFFLYFEIHNINYWIISRAVDCKDPPGWNRNNISAKKL